MFESSLRVKVMYLNYDEFVTVSGLNARVLISLGKKVAFREDLI